MTNSLFASPIICPVCETEREIPKREIPFLKCVVMSLLWAAMCGGATGLFARWNLSFVAAAAAGVLCFAILEVYYNAKLKRELVCPVCQFDPVLYRRSPEMAKNRCLEGLKRREQVFMAKWQALQRITAEEGNIK